MHPNLNWLCLSLVVSISIIAFISFGSTSADLNVFDAQRFEECVNTVLSRYPFLTKEDRWRMGKIVQKSTYRLKKDPTRLTEGKEIRHFGRKLATLVIVNDTWRDSREVAYVSAIERCSMLITGIPDNEMQNETLFYFQPHEDERIFGAGEDISKRPRMKLNKPFSLTSDTKLNLKRRSKRDIGLFSTLPQPINNQRQSQVETRVASVIRDILLKSPVFTKVFYVGLPQKDAIAISTDITEAGLKDFSKPIINDAVRAVINDLSFTTSSSNSENYAFIISGAVAETVRRYTLTLFDDGAHIAHNMIGEIETLLGSQGPNTQIPIPGSIQQPNPDFAVNKEVKFTQTILNQQPPNFNPVMDMPIIQPSPVTVLSPENSASKFQNTLVPLFTQSEEISSLICKGSTPDIFRMIKTALSNYGPIVSVNAAVAATDAFSQLNPQQSCSQYADVISKIIRDILFDNGLLEMADPLEIVKNFISSTKAYSGSPLTIRQNPNQQIDSGFKSSFPLLPSFSEITAPAFPQSFEKLEYPNEAKNPGMSESSVFNPLIQQPNAGKIENYTEIKASLPIDKSPISSTNYQAKALQPQPLNQPSKIETFIWDFEIAVEKALSHAPSFLHHFKSDITPSEAAKYASTMLKAVFPQKEQSIITEADNQIRSAISNLPIGSPSSVYAAAFSSAFTDILSKYNLIQSMNPKIVADKLIDALDKEARYRSSSVNRPLSETPLTSLAKSKAVIPASKSDLLPPVPTYQTPQSSSILPANQVNESINVSEFPLPLEAGSLISGNLSVVDEKFPPTTSEEFAPTTTMAPFLSTNSVTDFTSPSEFSSTFMEVMESTTTILDPYVKNLTDAIDEPSKLSELLMDGIASLLALSSQNSSPRNGDRLKPDESESLLKAVDITANSKPSDTEELKTTPVNSVSQESGLLDMNSKEIAASAAVSSESRSGLQPAIHPGTRNGDSSSVSTAVSAQIEPIIRVPSTELESSFNPKSGTSLENEFQRKETQSSGLFEKVSQISESVISFIKSPDFNLQELCGRLNELAELVGIEPVPADNCSGISVTDFLLHILKAVTSRTMSI